MAATPLPFPSGSLNDDSWILPLPATFVIDQHAIIRSADVRVDYRNRAEPAQTIEFLKRLRTRT